MQVRDKRAWRRLRIRKSIRKKLSGTVGVPRLSVYKSNRSVYVQLVDDERGHTLLSTSSRALGESGIDKVKARKVGNAVAEKALEKGISRVVFDRSGYLYHGRVGALAEGAREGGLKF